MMAPSRLARHVAKQRSADNTTPPRAPDRTLGGPCVDPRTTRMAACTPLAMSARGGLLVPPRAAAHTATGRAHPVVAPTLKDGRELFGRQILPAFVEQHGPARGLRLRNAPARLRQFGQAQWPGEPLFIARHELRFGRARDLAAGDDMQENGAPLRQAMVRSGQPGVGRPCSRSVWRQAFPATGGASPKAHIRSRL